MYERCFLILFAFVGSIYAQTVCNRVIPYVIKSQADADVLAICRGNVTRTILIDPGYVGRVEITGPIKVDFLSVYDTPLLTEISFPTLETVQNDIALSNCSSLTSVNLTNLRSVKVLTLENLPAIANLTILNPLEQLRYLSVNHTALVTFPNQYDNSFFKGLNIANNPILQSTTFPSSKFISIIFENTGNAIFSFPNVLTTDEITCRGCAGLLFPKLSSAGFVNYENTTLKTIEFPQLYQISGDDHGDNIALLFSGNSALTNLSLPELYIVGGSFVVANNTLLRNVEFPKLSLADELVLDGSFTTPPILPHFMGAILRIHNTENINCEKLRAGFIARGFMLTGFICSSDGSSTTDATSDSTSETAPTSSPSPTADSLSLSTRVKAGIGAGIGYPAAALLAGLLVFL